MTEQERDELMAEKMLAQEARRELRGLLHMVGSSIIKGQHPVMAEEILRVLEFNIRTLSEKFTAKLIRRAKGEADPSSEPYDLSTHNAANLVIFGILESQIEGKLNGIYRRLISNATKANGGMTDETKLGIANRFDVAVRHSWSVFYA